MTTTPLAAAATTTPSTSTTTSSSSSSSDPGEITSSEFMDLLTAQLQNQDPTNPVDPTQFASELVQFNSLESLLGIQGDLNTLVSNSTPTTSNPTGGTSPTARS